MASPTAGLRCSLVSSSICVALKPWMMLAIVALLLESCCTFDADNAHAAQDTIADMAKDMVKNRTGGSQASAAELYDFMKKVRCRISTARVGSSQDLAKHAVNA